MQLDPKVYEFPALNINTGTAILTKNNSDLLVLRFLEKETNNSRQNFGLGP